MKKLSEEDIKIKLSKDGEYIVASLFENEGYRDWKTYNLSDLPNDLISYDDLKRFGIDAVNI